MESTINSTIGANLAFARKYSNMTLETLAEACGKTKQTVAKYESGQLTPPITVLINLAHELGLEVEDLLRKDQAELFKRKLAINRVFENHLNDDDHFWNSLEVSREVNFREGDNVNEETLEAVKDDVSRIFCSIEELENILNCHIKFKNPVDGVIIKNRQDAEKAALKVRRTWKVGQLPIANVVELLENRGVRVIEVKQSLEFQGMSAWISETPIIIINSKVEEVTRRRFTTLHELAHLILEIEDHVKKEDVERICDAFAAMMLLPKELLILEVGGSKRTRLSKEELKEIKAKYGISVRAILVSSLFADVISLDYYKARRDELDYEPDLGKYKGVEGSNRLKRLITAGLVEGEISQNKAARLGGYTQNMLNRISTTI